MSYGRHPYGGVGYAGADVAEIPADTNPHLAVEVSFTTNALDDPAWVDTAVDCRYWDATRGRNRELEPFQPARATVVLANLSRQYDSVNEAGPWYGNIRPMRRMRIRETFSGVTYPVFDGYVDKWQLDYPATGQDATATLTATDGTKILARTDLPRSVYSAEVTQDAPLIWWRLDEDLGKFREGFALNSGAGGSAYNADFVASPQVGGERIVVNDPGTSLVIQDDVSFPGTPVMGTELDNSVFSLFSNTVFMVEAWVRLGDGASTDRVIWAVSRLADNTVHGGCEAQVASAGATTGKFIFFVRDSTLVSFYAVQTPDGSARPGEIHHVICVVETGGQMAIWLDGVRYTDVFSPATITTLSGVVRPTNGHMQIGHESSTSPQPDVNWNGEISEVAVYQNELTSARVNAHTDAGTHPWQDDLPGARIDRVLDLVGLPESQRDIADGVTVLQSAELDGQTAQAHVQKVSDTEGGLVFLSREGHVRFLSRAQTWGREPGLEVYGDDPGVEIGYTAFVPDDGDEVIRNRAFISRLNGVVKTAEDEASTDEFANFDFTLDGLYHQTETYSQQYADQIVAEYSQPRRRITSIGFADSVVGLEATHYPAILGRELADYITVRNRPPGGGDLFEQVCAVEGIRIGGTPKILTAQWMLSPRLGGEFPMDWADYTPTNTNITVGNGTQTARFARSGNTIVWRYILTFGSTTAFTGTVDIGLPVASSGAVGQVMATGHMREAGVASYTASAWVITADGTQVRPTHSVVGSGAGVVTSTTPFTWGTGDILSLGGVYEAA